ncbi:hypothetical protein F2Q69_00006419 [Brassica cretica]|uniref:Uncharacterized protein n=1 Tax=Brassica cretica TaxID=69181 RepID=A0A8S9P4G4_BRACR|nr:hypothetical protein F2Q69_00006419 [Brassica cretica]
MIFSGLPGGRDGSKGRSRSFYLRVSGDRGPAGKHEFIPSQDAYRGQDIASVLDLFESDLAGFETLNLCFSGRQDLISRLITYVDLSYRCGFDGDGLPDASVSNDIRLPDVDL